jgi:hypothetical protein
MRISQNIYQPENHSIGNTSDCRYPMKVKIYIPNDVTRNDYAIAFYNGRRAVLYHLTFDTELYTILKFIQKGLDNKELLSMTAEEFHHRYTLYTVLEVHYFNKPIEESV